MSRSKIDRLEALASQAKADALEIRTQALNDGARWIADRAARLATDCAVLLAEIRALESEHSDLRACVDCGARDGACVEHGGSL